MKKYAFLVAVLAASLVSACSDSSGDVIQSHGGNTNETSDNPDTCTDQCSEEGSTCESEGVILKCTDSNGDGCLELVRKKCAKGKICKNGKCSIVEDDAEEPVESEDHECNDNGDCSENQTCTNGKCVSKLDGCLDECSGASVCEGTDGYKECKDTNDDGCKEWTAVTKCDAGEVCSDGACKKAEPVCQDTCSGAVVCEGTDGYKECKDTNDDGCKEWTAVTKCDAGKSCSNGQCVTPICKYTSVKAPDIHPLPSEASAGTSESVTVNGFTDEYLYDATNYLKIGARREWGGSIIFFGISDGTKGTNGTNTIDGNDTGREVQVAIYDGSRQMQNCAYNASCATNGTACPGSITFLGWNPVQGGNRCNNGSGVDSVNNKDGIMEIVTTPLHWNPNWDATDCRSDGCETGLERRKSDVRLTQRLRFVKTHVVELYYSVQNLSDLSHTSSAQELPTLYAAYGAHGLGNYRRIMNADKTDIPIDEPANDGFYTKAFTSSEPWVTLQNAELTYGVGILYENGLLRYQGWQKSGVFNNVRSLLFFGLPPHGVVNARAYLILGNFDTVKAEAHWLMDNLPPFGVLDNPADGKSVSGKVDLSGWALDNKKVVKVEARIDESVTTALTYGTDRQDVCNVWIGYPSCNKVGFSGSIDVSALDKNCKHLLEIIATDDNGNSRVIANRLLTVN